MDHQVVTDYTHVEEIDNVKVFVRLRPPEMSEEFLSSSSDEEDDTSVAFPSPPSSPSAETASRAISKSSSFKSKQGNTRGYEVKSKKIITISKTTKSCGKKSKEPKVLNKHAFGFDRVFDTETDQSEIFKTVGKPLVDRVMKGFNACCFAYGQTGSGKTHTIFGESNGQVRGLVPRITEYLFEKIKTVECGSTKYKVETSFMEMYCDQIRDLGSAVAGKVRLASTSGKKKKMRGKKGKTATGGAELANGSASRRTSTAGRIHRNSLMRAISSPAIHHGAADRRGNQRRATMMMSSMRGGSGSRKELGGESNMSTSQWFQMHKKFGFSDIRIHEDEKGNVFVKDAAVMEVRSSQEVNQIVHAGLKLRATHETKMNSSSSRSHTIMTFKVIARNMETRKETVGLLNVIDLAGSERLKKSESEGQRLTEALFINRSLSALGKVVMSLDPTEKSSDSFVPYRDSKLTRLLQNSLGGNSYTTLLATIHPLQRHYEESLSTLHFAAHCRNVKNRPRVNYAGGAHSGSASPKRALRKLRAEVASLREKIKSMRQMHRIAMAQTMAQLGVRGQVLADGRVRLADGRTVGHAIFSDAKVGEEGASGGAENGVGADASGTLADLSLPIGVGDGGAFGDILANGGNLGGAGGFFPIGGDGRGGVSPALIDARVAPLKQQIKTLRRQNVDLRHALQRANQETRRVESMYSDRLGALREESRATKTQLKDATIGFENKSAQLKASFMEQLRSLASNRKRFEKDTMKVKVRVEETKRATLTRNIGTRNREVLSDANTELDVKLLQARLEETLARAEDAERKLRLASPRTPKRSNATRAFVEDLKYRDELVRMGQLAEQLITALHRGRTESPTPDDGAFANGHVENAKGPLPEGISGVEAAAAAAVAMSDPQRFPRYHSLRLPKRPAVDQRVEMTSESSAARASDVSIDCLRESSSSNHADTVRDLARKRTTEARLQEANRRYRSLRCAYDALLRRTQKSSSLSPKRGLGKVRAGTAEKRRVFLGGARSGGDSGESPPGQWRRRPRTAH